MTGVQTCALPIWNATFGALITDALKAEIDALAAGIKDGSIKVSDYFTSK